MPQFYLAGFTSDGTPNGALTVIHRRDGRVRLSSVRAEGYERDFHRFPGISDEMVFEKALAEVEGAWAKALKDILESSDPPQEAVELMLGLAALLHVRTPIFRRWYRALSEDLYRQMAEFVVAARFYRHIPMKVTVPPEDHIKEMMDLAEMVYGMLQRRYWSIYRLPSDAAGFITSDNPLAIFWDFPPDRKSAKRPPFIPGFMHRDSEIFLPLSKTVGMSGRFEAGPVYPDARIISVLNRRVMEAADRFLYCANLEFEWHSDAWDGRVTGHRLHEALARRGAMGRRVL